MKIAIATLLLLGCMQADAWAGCQSEIGKKKAAALAKQCLAVSESTHPPCDEVNLSCQDLTDEITRYCRLRRQSGIPAPSFCARYR